MIKPVVKATTRPWVSCAWNHPAAWAPYSRVWFGWAKEQSGEDSGVNRYVIKSRITKSPRSWQRRLVFQSARWCKASVTKCWRWKKNSTSALSVKMKLPKLSPMRCVVASWFVRPESSFRFVLVPWANGVGKTERPNHWRTSCLIVRMQLLHRHEWVHGETQR